MTTDPNPGAGTSPQPGVESDALLLHIDWTRCDGRGLCTELLADTLARDDWGYPIAVQQSPATRSNVVIAAGDRGAALDAVALCPRQALRLIRPVS